MRYATKDAKAKNSAVGVKLTRLQRKELAELRIKYPKLGVEDYLQYCDMRAHKTNLAIESVVPHSRLFGNGNAFTEKVPFTGSGMRLMEFQNFLLDRGLPNPMEILIEAYALTGTAAMHNHGLRDNYTKVLIPLLEELEERHVHAKMSIGEDGRLSISVKGGHLSDHVSEQINEIEDAYNAEFVKHLQGDAFASKNSSPNRFFEKRGVTRRIAQRYGAWGTRP